MSKKAKSKNKAKRLRDKAAKKAARQAQYDSYRQHGINTKSKRARRNEQKRQIVTHTGHGPWQCGNVGCIKCFGVSYNAWLDKDGVPRKMPQWLYIRWKKEQEGKK